jgi:transposase
VNPGHQALSSDAPRRVCLHELCIPGAWQRAYQRKRVRSRLHVPLIFGTPARHRHQEFLRFLKQVAKAYPRRELHIVCDNYATHKHPTVKTWLARHPRITLHFTPTSGSWLNLVEIFFGIITRQAIRRGSFDSVRELIDAIRRFIDAWNQRCEPFVWTKDADTILAKAKRSPMTKASAITRH